MPSMPVSESSSSLPTTTDFRIGTTSYIYPGGWLANARRLAFRVRDIDLLCFDTHSLPNRAERAGLLELKEQAGLSYTVHIPPVPALLDGSWLARRRAASTIRRIIARTRMLVPSAYIVHLTEAEGAPPDDVDRWQKRAATTVRRILASGIDPRTLCLQGRSANYARIAPLIERFGLSMALDISRGDEDIDWLRVCMTHDLSRIRVIEWHGVDPDGRDHKSVAHFPSESARWLIKKLGEAGYAGVLSLKVLSESDFEESIALVARILDINPHHRGIARP